MSIYDKNYDNYPSLVAKTLSNMPQELQGKIDFGLYGGKVQYFIVGVDGTLAQLGNNLPNDKRLLRFVMVAEKAHERLIKEHEGMK